MSEKKANFVTNRVVIRVLKFRETFTTGKADFVSVEHGVGAGGKVEWGVIESLQICLCRGYPTSS